jgi:hypothetical protein
VRIFIVALALLAADERYGYTSEQLNTSATSSIEYDSLSFPSLTPELKALPVAARAQAVTSLGKIVRAYVESPQFKDVYAEWLKSSRPPQPTPKRPYSELFAEKKKELEKSRADMNTALASLPANQRAQLKDAMEQGITQQLAMYKDEKMMSMMEEQRFQQEKSAYDQAMQKLPDDYRVLLRQRLQTFLTQTDGVDFAAKTTNQGGSSRFVNTEYETRSDLWKRCFRAGKPATDAARAFAKDWLAAVK